MLKALDWSEKTFPLSTRGKAVDLRAKLHLVKSIFAARPLVFGSSVVRWVSCRC